MKNVIGIRHEDKYAMERRVALIPDHVKGLIENYDAGIVVQTSAKRVFKNNEYLESGARIAEDLKDANVIFGVKEMPEMFFEKGKTYVFFSHVIKGQSYNMPMLKKMMEMQCNLIDYEKVTDDMGRRLIFFGRFAGLAGMINSLWSLGQRYKVLGMDTPFLGIRQSHTYDSLEDAKIDVMKAGMKIASEGLPDGIAPVVIGFTGYGQVSKGAQEIAALLPSIEITPEELLKMDLKQDLPGNVIIKVVFKEWDLSQPNDPSKHFELQDYYSHPEYYHNVFEKYVPSLTILMNCMYWDDRYPRIITKDFLEELYMKGQPKLTVIGDVTCDPDGSIECTHMGTHIEDPVFVYNPFTREAAMGFEGDGILDMAVDILPSELPRESSIAFSEALLPYVPGILAADFDASFESMELPPPIKRAMILHKGRFTPEYEYIKEYIK